VRGQEAPQASAQQGKIEELVKQLGHQRFRVREEAMKKLADLGKAAVPALRAALKSDDPDLRLRAGLVLSKIESGVPHLLQELKSKKASERLAAAKRLGELGPRAKDAVGALVLALKDPDEAVRGAAAEALGNIDPDNKALAGLAPGKASVNGKYRKLLRKFKVAEDRGSYGDFTDYGYYTGTSWRGHVNLPPGYWVYVYPNWYIWGEVKPGKGAPPPPPLPRPKTK
jgi:hypothetical protein